MSNKFKKIKLKKKKLSDIDKLLLRPPQIGIVSLDGDKSVVHQLMYDKNLVKNIKKIIPEGVKNILFQPYVGKRRRPDVVLISKQNKYYEMQIRLGNAATEKEIEKLLTKAFKSNIEIFKEKIANDPVSKAMQKVKEATTLPKEVTEALNQKVINALSIPEKTEIKTKKPADIKNADGSVTTFEEVWYSHLKKWVWEPCKVRTLPNGKKVKFYKNNILTEGKVDDGKKDFLEWCFDNDIDMWDMWKHYKKHKDDKKRYSPKTWADLCMVLNSLNFNPKEILSLAIDKTQTKEQFLKHRLYRSIEQRNTYALRTFINVLRKNKLPDKTLLGCPDMEKWMNENQIYFQSPETLRRHRNNLIEAYNKLRLYPPYNPKKKTD